METFEQLQRDLKAEAQARLDAIREFQRAYDATWSEAMQYLALFLQGYGELKGDMAKIYAEFADRELWLKVAEYVDAAIQAAQIGHSIYSLEALASAKLRTVNAAQVGEGAAGTRPAAPGPARPVTGEPYTPTGSLADVQPPPGGSLDPVGTLHDLRPPTDAQAPVEAAPSTPRAPRGPTPGGAGGASTVSAPPDGGYNAVGSLGEGKPPPFGGMTILGNDTANVIGAQVVEPWPGVHDVHTHGRPGRLTAIIDGNRVPLTPGTAEGVIRASGWKTGTPIRLMACDTAGDFAQQLADRLGVEVWAPNADITIHWDTGAITFDAPSNGDIGRFVRHSPRGVQ
jgi:hypothetical protein